MAVNLDSAIASLRRRAVATAWLARVGALTGWTLAAGGALALVARGVADWERADAAWLLAPALAAPLIALVVARRSRPSDATAAAWLDVHAGATGYVVTENELGQSSWTPRTELALARALEALPRPDLARPARPVLAALAFAALALWIELPEHVVGPPPAVSVAALDRIEDKLEVLEDALALEPELAEELEQRLEAARADSEAGDPESTFEALDRLEERIEAQAQEAEQLAEQAAAELAKAASDPSLAQAQDALQSALARMASGGLTKDLPKDLSDALPNGVESLDGQQLSSAELAKLAQELKGALDGRMAKLAGGRLIDASKLGKLGEPLSLDDLDPEHECDEDCKKPGGT